MTRLYHILARRRAAFCISLKLTAFFAGRNRRPGLIQRHTEHRRHNGAAHEAIQPVIVGPFQPQFPFIDSPSPAFSLHAVFHRQMFRK